MRLKTMILSMKVLLLGAAVTTATATATAQGTTRTTGTERTVHAGDYVTTITVGGTATTITDDVKSVTAPAGSTVRVVGATPPQGKVARLRITKTASPGGGEGTGGSGGGSGEGSQTTNVPVMEITVNAPGGCSIIPNASMIYMTATVTPSNASEKGVTWSVADGHNAAYTDEKDCTYAQIYDNGILFGKNAGEITVFAKAKDGSGVYGALNITIYNIKDLDISVTGKDGANTVMQNETLQMVATVDAPDGADKSVTWSVCDTDDGETPKGETCSHASISDDGVLTGLSPGKVIVFAESNVNPTIVGSCVIEVTDGTSQAGTGGANPGGISGGESLKKMVIESSNAGGLVRPSGMIRLTAKDMDGKVIDAMWTFTVTSLSESNMSFDPTTGILTGGADGEEYLVRASAKGYESRFVFVTVSESAPVYVPVSEISEIGGLKGSDIFIGVPYALTATVSPSNATEPGVIWGVAKGEVNTPTDVKSCSYAVISEEGVITGKDHGTVTVFAVSKDYPTISSRQIIYVDYAPISIRSVGGTGGANTVNINETLQMKAIVNSSEPVDQSVTWRVADIDGSTLGEIGSYTRASIDENGILTGVSAGMVRVYATSKYKPDVKNYCDIEVTDGSGTGGDSGNGGNDQPGTAVNGGNGETGQTGQASTGGNGETGQTGMALTVIKPNGVTTFTPGAEYQFTVQDKNVNIPVSEVNWSVKAPDNNVYTDTDDNDYIDFIESGWIMFKRDGDYTIYATLKSDPNVVGSCHIYVFPF